MPRIRTIKPEFWSDEKLAPLDPVDRLTFLGLISLADDFGRVHDNLKVIDAFVFPECSRTVRESLAKLSRMGRIRRGKSSSGKLIIEIQNWTKHQRVDKPQTATALPPIVPEESERDQQTQQNIEDSSIPEPFANDSGTAPEVFRTLSGTRDQGPGTLDQGSGTRDRSPRSAEVSKPTEVDQQSWDDWKSARKTKRAGPITQTVLTMIEREAESAGMSLNEAIVMAAGSSWITFKAEYIKGKGNQPRAPVTFAQQSALNTKEGGEKFLKEMQELFGDEETGLSELQDGNGNTLRLLGEGSK
jgi:hypothetical protein